MYLEFEKPIFSLESKLSKLKQEYEAGNIELKPIIANLEKEIELLQKEVFENLTRWQRVQLARHTDRPYTLDYITNIAEDFIELHGDRYAGDDPAMVGGFGDVDGQTIMFIGQQKGRTTKERQKRNFGMASPEGYRKALRLMKIAEKFNKPIVTLIDTPGAYPGLEAEERGQGSAIANNIKEMFDIKVPILVIVIGEGASGGALGIGVGDKILMLENTWYSVISPESCSSILWKSWDYKEQAADSLKLTSSDMLNMKLIDEVIKEPIGGAHRHPNKIYQSVKKQISIYIKELLDVLPEQRIATRINKFCSMGSFDKKRNN